jgi:hypothetical protein
MHITMQTVAVNSSTFTSPPCPAYSKFLRLKNTVSGANDIVYRRVEADSGTEDTLPAGTWVDFEQEQDNAFTLLSTPFAIKTVAGSFNVKLEWRL